MIAIFTVLGLVLFGGGAYAIIDGWPYLVLERGFTQVIIGSIASTAGLILLSLAWVLKEVKSLRETFYDAIEARAEARPAAPAPAMDEVRVPAEVRMPSAQMPASMPVLVPAAVSAAAAGAVATALSAPAEDEPHVAPKPAAADTDLFGDLVARRLSDPAPEPEEPVAEAPAAETPSLPDMFESMLADQLAASPEREEPPVAVATESHEPVEIVSAKVQPISEDEALAHSDELAHDHLPYGERLPPVPVPVDVDEDARAEDPAPEPEDHAKDAVGADVDAPAQEEPLRAVTSSNLDEFSALRESLTGHLRQSSRESERIEPALEPEADPFAVAESWMDRAPPRREPWFEAPAPANEPEPEAAPAEPAAPLWPPRTGVPDFDEPFAANEPDVGATPEEAPAVDAEQPPAEADLPEPDVEATEAEAEVEPETPAPEPAASDEGVVGAYQVGDAHFTIYADGSIRARTPDGEYSFASMDELKVYLASEKSRLGA